MTSLKRQAEERVERKRRKLRRITEENEPSEEPTSSQISVHSVIDADAEEAELEMEQNEEKKVQLEPHDIAEASQDEKKQPNAVEDKVAKDKKILEILFDSPRWKEKLGALHTMLFHLLHHSETKHGMGFGPLIDVKAELKGCEMCRVDSPLVCFMCKEVHNFQILLNRESGKLKIQCVRDESESWGQIAEVHQLDYYIIV
jgi:hypothetical protein